MPGPRGVLPYARATMAVQSAHCTKALRDWRQKGLERKCFTADVKSSTGLGKLAQVSRVNAKLGQTA